MNTNEGISTGNAGNIIHTQMRGRSSPRRNCKHCYGRGYVGKREDGSPYPCRCIGRKPAPKRYENEKAYKIAFPKGKWEGPAVYDGNGKPKAGERREGKSTVVEKGKVPSKEKVKIAVTDPEDHPEVVKAVEKVATVIKEGQALESEAPKVVKEEKFSL